jgi:hypothetical protein
MREEWAEIIEFPSYSVSSRGTVRNEESGRFMTLHVNQRGIVNVSFNRRGHQFKRSVSVLVADAFITAARSLKFDTPINLDGDRLNNCVENLMWRPRWYATEYFRQFHFGHKGIDRAIQEMKTGEVFNSSWEAALYFGLLETEIVKAISNRTYVWPTYQRFEVVYQ